MASPVFMMGNPLLDISAEVDQAFLDKYGFQLNNAILAEDKHLPVYEELMAMPNVEFIAGGATQNSARVCQWIMQKPKSVVYSGCVGKDKYAEKLGASATADNVDVQYYVVDDTPTGTCAVLVNGKERSLCANLAAANKYSNEHLKGADMQAKMTAAQLYYNAGFFLTVSPESAMDMAKHANSNGKTYCLNLSAPFIMEVPPFKAAVDSLLPLTDFLFGNESEAATFGKVSGWGDISVKEVAEKIQKMPKEGKPRYVVFTQGSTATVVAGPDGVKEYPVPAVPAEEIVDTNGAGDAFVGGFLAQLAQGKPIEECVRCGHWAGGVIIRRSGCAYPEKPDFA
jgi:adenosine kinase